MATVPLRHAIETASSRAIAAGHVKPPKTTLHRFREEDIEFVAYHVEKSQKSEAPQVSRDGIDVFLPYDPQLYVADASPEHVLLLNKYPSLPHSVVIPTKTLVPQESNLTPMDVRALWGVVAASNAFGFFNCGRDAGYSQEHKHMQAILLPQTDIGDRVPVDTAHFHSRAAPWKAPSRIPQFQFHHAAMLLPPGLTEQDPDEGARIVFDAYTTMMHLLGIPYPQQTIPGFISYNFVLTPRWCMVVPRCRENFEYFYHNSLAFCGIVFTAFREGIEWLRAHGVLRTLNMVTYPAQAPLPPPVLRSFHEQRRLQKALKRALEQQPALPHPVPAPEGRVPAMPSPQDQQCVQAAVELAAVVRETVPLPPDAPCNPDISSCAADDTRGVLTAVLASDDGVVPSEPSSNAAATAAAATVPTAASAVQAAEAAATAGADNRMSPPGA